MQNKPSEDSQDQTVFTPLEPSMSGSQQPLNGGKPVQPESKQSLFYTQEDDLDLHLPPRDEQDEPVDQSAPFVLPFQSSAAMPTIASLNAQGSLGAPPPGATPTPKKHWGSFHLLKVLLIALVVLITGIGASVFLFAQPATSPTTTPVSSTHLTGTIGTSPVATAKPTPTHPSPPQATATSRHPGQGTQGSGTSSLGSIPSGQLLNQLGWTPAGLTLGDALEALRTGSTFTDREMSYDYRTIGTPTNHSGTLTGAAFLLTSGGQVRFMHNDVRVINNVLYDKIRTGKIIQQVVNAQPSLVHFQMVPVQGQPYPFAWVNVDFELLQSNVDPASGTRTESLQIDPAGQPILHHMTVVLVRVAPQNQGANAPMGGTGWLVDTYELDTNTLPAIATEPSL